MADRQRPRIVISDERNEILGTGGGVVKALPLLGAAPFFHMNADTMWIDGVRSNLARLAEAFDPARMDMLMLMAPTTASIGYDGRGDYTMSADGTLHKRKEKQIAPFVYAGAADRCRRSCSRPRRTANSACRDCSTPRRKPAGCSDCGSKAPGCMSERPTRSPRPNAPCSKASPEACSRLPYCSTAMP